jgi:endonuclease G
MAAPRANLHYMPGIAAEASQRWKSRTKKRDSKVAAAGKGQYTKAESKERLAKHVNRLLNACAGSTLTGDGNAAQESMAQQIPELKGLARHGEVTATDINNRFVERVIGQTRDFLAIQFFDRGTVASRAVCRIVTQLPGGQAFGTGFLVTPHLLLTNHHVFQDAATARQSHTEFNYQLSLDRTLPIESFELSPDTFFLTDEGLDFSLVAVAPRSANGTPLASFGFCPLIGAEGKILTGQPVNVIQHPNGDLKQVVIRDNKLLDLPEKAKGTNIDQYAYYQADTEPGSSGSPVFNDQWEVIALHHSGVPRTNAAGQSLDANGKVVPAGGDPSQIMWIANEGIRTSRLVTFISAASVDGGRDLLNEFIAISRGEVKPPATETLVDPTTTTTTTATTVVQPQHLVSPPPPPPPSISNPASVATAASVSITVPLTITLGFGAQAAAAPALPAVPAPASPAAPALASPAIVAIAGPISTPDSSQESGKPAPNMAGRPGFDAKFLGFNAPLPALAAAVRNLAAPVNTGGIELKYFHYSVIMNSARKLAFVSAVNLDVGAKFSVKREGKDHWYYDDRMSRDLQAGPELYADNPLDFGHLTRRQDAAWGDTEASATSANNDTFHLTNCSPQHAVFNESSQASHNGVLLWGNLEMYVTSQAKKGSKKLSIFNGPVFRASDAPYRGILLPKEFWKLIVYVRDNGKPGAVAFVLSQESLIKNLPAEDFVVGPYKPFQVKISDLERRTNLDFGVIETFDTMGQVGQESLMEGVRSKVVSIETFADIVV